MGYKLSDIQVLSRHKTDWINGMLFYKYWFHCKLPQYVACIYQVFTLYFLFKGGRSIWIRKTGSLLKFQNLAIFEKCKTFFMGSIFESWKNPKGCVEWVQVSSSSCHTWSPTTLQHRPILGPSFVPRLDQWPSYGDLQRGASFIKRPHNAVAVNNLLKA